MNILSALCALLLVALVQAEDPKHPMCFKHEATVTEDKKSLQTVLEDCLGGKKDGAGPEIECCLTKMGMVQDGKVKIEELGKALQRLTLEKHITDVTTVFDACKGDDALQTFADCCSKKFEGKCDDFGWVGGKKA